MPFFGVSHFPLHPLHPLLHRKTPIFGSRNGDAGPFSHYKNGAVSSSGREALAIQPSQHRTCSDSGDKMLPSLKTAFTLLSLLQLISSRAVTPSPQQILKEVILLIQQLNSGVQVNAAAPLGFALLTDLVIVYDADDVLQCPRPGTSNATTGTGACLGGRSPSRWLNPLHPTSHLGHPGPFQPRLCVIST